ncbi:MAG: hypothetical protein K8U03_05495 [Planctomycetia bacterium]|nr:hypothetical protein [Planctomycetia bacterium]
MDRSRKATREANETTLQHKSRADVVMTEELMQERLAGLQSLIEQIQKKPPGKIEIARRISAFGECTKIETESAGQYYERLRIWLERRLPQKRRPLHPPRQNGA